jgi:kinesin family protein 13
MQGIVPISCEEIFTRIAKNDNPNKEYEVQISMMEIYNEKVQDLLIPIAKRPKEGHKIREHKTLGIYVEGMSKHFVDTYDLIEKKMEEGGRNRSIAATEMNASSSRAHTIISIEFKQTEVGENGKKREKLSVIHLVDLAGSEKVGKTGATGDRLKEAAGINKSLSVLGLVISALADKALGKGKGVVPYRDSCLTRILQNALGGNSKTLMICAISPATDNYEETLSTLRYADQAKKIQNKAVVNESETDKLIRTLTAERE